MEIYRLSELGVEKKREAARFIAEQFEDLFRFKRQSQKRLRNLLEQALVESQCIVMLDDEKIIGLVTISTTTKPSLSISRRQVQKILGYGQGWLFCLRFMNSEINLGGTDVYLSTLAVHPDYRRQGIATQLIQWVIQNHPQNTYLLEVNKVNKGAIRLYESLGFQVFKRKKQYFAKQSRSNELLYMKRMVN